jgi:hypothetical protein
LRVLLDEHLPVRLAREFGEHDVSTVRREGWLGVKNGALLGMAAEAGFEVLVTNDRSIEFQQDPSKTRLGVVVLDAPSNRLDEFVGLVPQILVAIAAVRPGEVRHLTYH